MYLRVAQASLLGGLFFAVLEVVYGYFFGVWHQFNQEVVTRPAMSMSTKFGEMVLFGFLAITLPLISIAASLLARSQ